MTIVDDPMLVLITRFVVNEDRLDIANEEFIKRQIKAIDEHVSRFPRKEKEERALEWIAAHAKKYRQDWQRRVVSTQAPGQRCEDCPLDPNEDLSQCEIHDNWVGLMQRYLDGRITSRAYVEDTLTLLKDHKTRLTVAGYRKMKKNKRLDSKT